LPNHTQGEPRKVTISGANIQTTIKTQNPIHPVGITQKNRPHIKSTPKLNKRPLRTNPQYTTTHLSPYSRWTAPQPTTTKAPTDPPTMTPSLSPSTQGAWHSPLHTNHRPCPHLVSTLTSPPRSPHSIPPPRNPRPSILNLFLSRPRIIKSGTTHFPHQPPLTQTPNVPTRQDPSRVVFKTSRGPKPSHHHKQVRRP